MVERGRTPYEFKKDVKDFAEQCRKESAMDDKRIFKVSTREHCGAYYDTCDKPDGYNCKELCEHHDEYANTIETACFDFGWTEGAKLAPCPFCNSKALHCVSSSENMGYDVCMCSNAECKIHGLLFRFEFWNTRPESSPAPEIVVVKKSCKNCNHFEGCEKLCMEDRKMWEPKDGAIAIYHEAVTLPTPPSLKSNAQLAVEAVDGMESEVDVIPSLPVNNTPPEKGE